MLEDHAPNGDHHCGVDNNVSACPDLFAGICSYVVIKLVDQLVMKMFYNTPAAFKQ